MSRQVRSRPGTTANGGADSSELDPFLSLRSAVIFIAALMIATVFGGLTYLDQHSTPVSGAVGLTVFGTVVMGLHKLLGR